MARTLLLDRTAWDLVLDAAANIAVASDPYSISQDICSAIRLFSGELWYDTTQGIPYFSQILGHYPPVEYMRSQFVNAALSVPGVLTASCLFSSLKARALSGQVQFTYSVAGAAAPNSTGGSGIITFYGTNLEDLIFVGTSGLILQFEGSS